MGTYTGNGSNNQTIGHGLGARPNWIIVKRKDTAAAWLVWHEGNSWNHVLRFYTNTETDSASGRVGAFNNGDQGTSSIFSVFAGSSAYDNCNINGDEYIFWAWTEKQGYSKFGKYVGYGDGSAGPFVYTGFKPAFVMIKVIDAVESWVMFDNKRKPFNRDDNVASIYANTTAPEYTGASYHNIDMLSNGFRVLLTNTAVNVANKNYVYMAFAESPFVTSTGVPATAR